MKEPEAVALVLQELQAARLKFGPFNTQHEGYAVILEELDELWTEVKKKHRQRDPEATKREAVQVAAMSLRFLVDLT